jgi:hypothetical protein
MISYIMKNWQGQGPNLSHLTEESPRTENTLMLYIRLLCNRMQGSMGGRSGGENPFEGKKYPKPRNKICDCKKYQRFYGNIAILVI